MGKHGIDVKKQVEFKFVDNFFIQSEIGIGDPAGSKSFVTVSVPSRYADEKDPIFGGAIYIDHPDLVDYYTELFESLWEKAEPLSLEGTNEKDH